jgi:outer membrane murein-binding lipoprotein Lpp
VWWWVIGAVVLLVSGIGVLAAITVRLWRQVRQLGRDVAAAGDRLARATDELQRVAPPAQRR